MTNKDLSEAELDLVSGAVRDNPFSDAVNHQAAVANRGYGTMGGSIYNNQFIGPEPQPPVMGGNPVVF